MGRTPFTTEKRRRLVPRFLLLFLTNKRKYSFLLLRLSLQFSCLRRQGGRRRASLRPLGGDGPEVNWSGAPSSKTVLPEVACSDLSDSSPPSLAPISFSRRPCDWSGAGRGQGGGGSDGKRWNSRHSFYPFCHDT